MAYYIELNIESCTVGFVHALEELGAKNDYNMSHHGWDRLVFIFDSTVGYLHAVGRITAVCESYGIKYTDLLV